MITFRTAVSSDTDAIVHLVNSAYRGDSSRKGWTTEADLIEGTRTDRSNVLNLIQSAESRIELAFRDHELVGCVSIKKENAQTLYFGMLTVKPEHQAKGLGKILIEHLESIARSLHCSQIRITVIHVRRELIEYYERRGFKFTGSFEVFHENETVFGKPLVSEIKLAEFIKRLE